MVFSEEWEGAPYRSICLNHEHNFEGIIIKIFN